MSSLTQALPVGKQLSKKVEVSHVWEAVDTHKYSEPMRRKIHILKLEWDRAAKFRQSRQIDNEDVEARLESLQANPPRKPLKANV